jgi:hypothetical protein
MKTAARARARATATARRIHLAFSTARSTRVARRELPHLNARTYNAAGVEQPVGTIKLDAQSPPTLRDVIQAEQHRLLRTTDGRFTSYARDLDATADNGGIRNVYAADIDIDTRILASSPCRRGHANVTQLPSARRHVALAEVEHVTAGSAQRRCGNHRRHG